jgi:hypothetical protein
MARLKQRFPVTRDGARRKAGKPAAKLRPGVKEDETGQRFANQAFRRDTE